MCHLPSVSVTRSRELCTCWWLLVPWVKTKLTIGEWLCLIPSARHPPSCTARKTSEKFKLKIHVCIGNLASEQTGCLRLPSHQNICILRLILLQYSEVTGNEGGRLKTLETSTRGKTMYHTDDGYMCIGTDCQIKSAFLSQMYWHFIFLFTKLFMNTQNHNQMFILLFVIHMIGFLKLRGSNKLIYFPS